MAFKDVWINKLARLAGAISTDRWLQWAGQPAVLPFYHAIADEHLPHIAPLYPVVSVAQFQADLDFLLQHFDPVELPKLRQIVSGNIKPSRPVFHLSFDDGLRQCYDVVAPILQKRGIPATFFLNTAFIDNADLFYRYKVALALHKWRQASKAERRHWQENMEWTGTYRPKPWLIRLGWHQRQQVDKMGAVMGLDFEAFLASRQPYLSRTQARELRQQGFTVGSHSVDHPEFSAIGASECQRQVMDSLAYLEQELGIEQRVFAFPFTDHGISKTFIHWLHDPNGGNVQLSFGTAGLKQDVIPFHLQRIPMEAYGVPGRAVIKGELSYYLIKKWLGKTTIKR